MNSDNPPQYTSEDLKEKETAFINFIKLLEDPTRLRIILLFLQYKRLSLTQISKLIGRTKPAITHQINKFIDIGIIRVIKLPVQGSITANYYELITKKIYHAVDREDPNEKIPRNLIKEMEILQIRAEKEAYKFTGHICLQIADIYDQIEKRARKHKGHFENNIPTFNLSIFPLSRKAFEVYSQELNKILSKINKIMEEEKEILERPLMCITSTFPLQEFYSHNNTE